MPTYGIGQAAALATMQRMLGKEDDMLKASAAPFMTIQWIA